MEANLNKKSVELGLRLVGIVMAKNVYTQKSTGEMRHQLDIACPGNRENITVSVDAKDFNEVTEMDKFDRRITVSAFNGRVSFNLLN